MGAGAHRGRIHYSSASRLVVCLHSGGFCHRFAAELGILDREIKRVKNGRMYLIPASAETRGHGTTLGCEVLEASAARVLGDATLAGQ
jgi:hypothetical protein